MSRYNIVSTIFLTLFIGSLAIDGSYSIPWWWYAGLISIFLVICIYGSIVLSSSYFIRVKSTGKGERVALTFDDGPLPGMTDKILDVLNSHNVKATFFCIGHRVQKNPEIVERIDREGHLIGNHTFWHGPLFDLKSSSMMTKELADTDAVLTKVISRRPRFFRPPYGVTNPMLSKAVRRRNYTVIGWSIRSFDSVTRDPEKLYRRITRRIGAGDVVLLHDYSESMLAILPRIIEHVQQNGLKIVRVDEMFNERGYV